MSEEDLEVQDQETEVRAILEGQGDESDKIRELHELGYTNAQLYKEFGFSRSLVYQVCPVKPERKAPKEEKHEGNDLRLPMTLKTGQGRESLTPEGILQSYLVEDGNAGQQLLKGFMLYRAAQLAVMNDVEILKGQAEAQATMIRRGRSRTPLPKGRKGPAVKSPLKQPARQPLRWPTSSSRGCQRAHRQRTQTRCSPSA